MVSDEGLSVYVEDPIDRLTKQIKAQNEIKLFEIVASTNRLSVAEFEAEFKRLKELVEK